MNWKMIEALVPRKGEAPNFDACLKAFPQLEMAKTTPQSPVHHGEGDVWTHTMMVILALLAMPEYQALTRDEQVVVFLAALLHDISKYSTTVIDPDTGKISQPGHSKKGAIDARIALWDAEAPFAPREAICRLIAVHQVPFFATGEEGPDVDEAEQRRKAEFTVRLLSCQLSIKLLAMLAEADMRGRISPDQAKVLARIQKFRDVAHDEDCYDKPRHFADAHTRLAYFKGANVHPDYPLYQNPGSKVIVMCGLPASGKNTWVEKNYPGLPVISFDDAREELGLKHGKNEGKVAHLAVDRAKELLRAKKPFIWNATNLTLQLRTKTLDQLFAYNAEVELVYLEKPRAELLRRNTKRDTSLTNKTLQAMLFKWELPVPTEAHSVTYLQVVENA